MIMDYIAGLFAGIVVGFITCAILVYWYIRENNIKIKVEVEK